MKFPLKLRKFSLKNLKKKNQLNGQILWINSLDMFKTILLKFFSIKQHLLFKIGKYLNFTLSKKINNVKVVIPVFGNIGLTNLVLKKNWLDLLIK